MFYLVPESGTRQKLIPDFTTHVPETGTSFLVPVSGQYVMGRYEELVPVEFELNSVLSGIGHRGLR